MAAFSDEEKRILANILPGVAAALRSPLNNLHMAAQSLTPVSYTHLRAH